ncbi:unnamed protein product [Boreogadus saida]
MRLVNDSFCVDVVGEFAVKAKELVVSLNEACLQLELIDIQSSADLRQSLQLAGSEKFWTREGYLFEPEFSQEELREREEEDAAAAAEQALPVAEDEEPERAGVNWWCTCLLCSPKNTNTESMCCSEFQRCQFLLE